MHSKFSPSTLSLAPKRWVQRLAALWRRRFGVLPLHQSLADMGPWFETPLGQALLQAQKEQLGESLNCLFGYHLLQLGISECQDMTESVRIPHRFILHPHASVTGRVDGLADFNHLPLASESIDAVVLHHALDYTQSPHQLLREAARVLIPRGHMVIIGFNPWSLWGLGSRLARVFSAQARWRYQYLRLGRLLDWLSLLNFEAVEVTQGFYRSPLPQPKAIRHLQWLESWGKRWRLPGGGFYMIVARKDHLAMTPLKPSWQPTLPLRGLAVPRLVRQGERSGMPLAPEPPDTRKPVVENRRNIH